MILLVEQTSAFECMIVFEKALQLILDPQRQIDNGYEVKENNDFPKGKKQDFVSLLQVQSCQEASVR